MKRTIAMACVLAGLLAGCKDPLYHKPDRPRGPHPHTRPFTQPTTSAAQPMTQPGR